MFGFTYEKFKTIGEIMIVNQYTVDAKYNIGEVGDLLVENLNLTFEI